jgi:hypothetical protein
MSKKAMKLALEALKTERDNYLEYDPEDGAPDYIYEAITSLEFEVAKQEQGEPVACVGPWHDARLTLIPRYSHQTFERDQPLYITPQQRKPLTDEQIKAIRVACGDPLAIHIEFARAIEAAHGIKE